MWTQLLVELGTLGPLGEGFSCLVKTSQTRFGMAVSSAMTLGALHPHLKQEQHLLWGFRDALR